MVVPRDLIRGGRPGWATVIGALLAFAVATEVFVAYDRGVNESTYWTLAIAALATVLTLAHLRREAR
jgi:hypothetical protein